jgi:hypothetical protein
MNMPGFTAEAALTRSGKHCAMMTRFEWSALRPTSSSSATNTTSDQWHGFRSARD